METKPKKNKRFAIVLGVLVIAGASFGITKYIHGQHHEETDDAQVEGDISPIIPKVPGYVDRLFVDDNVAVQKGDTLVVLDDRDLALRLRRAREGRSVGREGEIQSGNPSQHRNQLLEIAAHEGLAARQPHLRDAEATEDVGEAGDLFEREQCRTLEENVILAEHFFRHAVHTAEITAIGYRYPEIAQRATERVRQRRLSSGIHEASGSGVHRASIIAAAYNPAQAMTTFKIRYLRPSLC